jgi:hypothetical protein
MLTLWNWSIYLIYPLFTLTPVCCPFSLSVDDIHEFFCNNPACLLTWVERIEPLEAIRASIYGAILPANDCTSLACPCHIQRRSTIQILSWVGVNVGHQAVDVVVYELRSGVLLRNLCNEWRTVLVDIVERCNGVLHTIMDVGLVATICGPELSCIKATL